ncbi:hypothetical protein J2T56_001684 [Natronobacillus azotifigens]
MKFNKKLFTTILSLVLLFILTNEVSSYTINNPPVGNWTYSGYRPELRASFVIPYEKLSSLNDYNTN